MRGDVYVYVSVGVADQLRRLRPHSRRRRQRLHVTVHAHLQGEDRIVLSSLLGRVLARPATPAASEAHRVPPPTAAHCVRVLSSEH